MNFNVYSDVLVLGFLNFFFEMFLVQTLFMYKQKKRPLFPLRMLLTATAAIPFYFIPALNVGPFSLAYLAVVAYLLISGMVCYKTSFINVLFYTIASFAAQHFAWEILLILYSLIPAVSRALGVALYFIVFIAAYAALFFVFPFRAERDVAKRQRGAALLGSGLIIVITFILSSIVPAVGGWTVTYRCYALVCCVCALCTQFGVLKRSELEEKNEKLRSDKAVLEELLHKEKKQQEFSKDTIEYINMKCHDLKHQIGVLRFLSKDKQEESIRGIENAVMIYDNIAKTGNAALDVVLTEKGLLCEKYNIRFTYMVDGEKLNFLNPVDVSSLFGNALSNAIESVMREPDEDKRIIRLNASARRRILSIHVENYCSEEVEFAGGLPVTVKEDKREHGFGVKSMRYIVEKYGGSLLMRREGELFNLDIVLPLPAEAHAAATA